MAMHERQIRTTPDRGIGATCTRTESEGPTVKYESSIRRGATKAPQRVPIEDP